MRRAFELSAENLEESQIALQIEKAVSDLRMNANTSEVFAALNNRVRHPFVAEFTSILEQTEKYGVGSNADLDRLIKKIHGKLDEILQVKQLRRWKQN